MVVQTLANVYQTTRSQVAVETAANCHCQMLASHTLRSVLTVTLFVCLPIECRREVALFGFGTNSK